jgi:hypothetical protein
MLADRVDDYRLSLGMIVGITDGKNHLATSYDRCDVACGRRIDEATIFEIGSVTKLFDCPPFGGDGEPRRSTIGRACGRPLAFWYASPKPQWTGNHASRSGIALLRISPASNQLDTE